MNNTAELTHEDAEIMARMNHAVDVAYIRARNRDADILAELAEGCRDIGRATLCPVTLATIGLDAGEFKRIVRERIAEQGARKAAQVSAELAELTMRHTVLCAFKARPADVLDLEYCPHGQAFDTAEHCDARHACEECGQSIAEDSEVPAEWFAGGFAPNH